MGKSFFFEESLSKSPVLAGVDVAAAFDGCHRIGEVGTGVGEQRVGSDLAMGVSSASLNERGADLTAEKSDGRSSSCFLLSSWIVLREAVPAGFPSLSDSSGGNGGGAALRPLCSFWASAFFRISLISWCRWYSSPASWNCIVVTMAFSGKGTLLKGNKPDHKIKY